VLYIYKHDQFFRKRLIKNEKVGFSGDMSPVMFYIVGVSTCVSMLIRLCGMLMRLNDAALRSALELGQIQISPSPMDRQIRGASIDLTLGQSFRIFEPHRSAYLDLGDAENLKSQIEALSSKEIQIAANDRFFLHPNRLVLAVSEEIIQLADDLVGWLDGRSSLARLGLIVHLTAHRIDPGWQGRIVFELQNVGPVPLALKPGIKVAAVSFEQMVGPTKQPYAASEHSKYRFQMEPQPSQMAQDER